MAGSASGRQDEGASVLIGHPSRKDVAVSLLCLVDKHNENRQQRRPERWSYLFCPFGISPALYRKERFCFGHKKTLIDQARMAECRECQPRSFSGPFSWTLTIKKVKKKKLASFHPAWPNKLGQN